MSPNALVDEFEPCGAPCWLCGENLFCVLPLGHDGDHSAISYEMEED